MFFFFNLLISMPLVSADVVTKDYSGMTKHSMINQIKKYIKSNQLYENVIRKLLNTICLKIQAETLEVLRQS